MTDRTRAQVRRFEASYDVWRRITYQPAIDHHLPEELLPRLPERASVLDIGCHDGAVCMFLAAEGFTADGVDINANAIQRAVAAAMARGLDGRTNFSVADAVEQPLAPRDAVTLIRVLTCVPDEEDWHRMLRHAWSAVRPGGLLYVHEFLRMEDSPVYSQRYKDGLAKGWRVGNFLAVDRNGDDIFIAHHHDHRELELIADAGETLVMRQHSSVSMNGNPCRMFIYVGRKPLSSQENLHHAPGL
jgi:SAM-dependent methyltransferase